MKNWQRIRFERSDLTDYVTHLTKDHVVTEPEYKFTFAIEVFLRILKQGVIKPTFAPIKSKQVFSTNNTVRGPYPAVCLTEQPLSAILTTIKCLGRYSGYGIAYHKSDLFAFGARPVLYGDASMLGERIRPEEEGYQEGKDIYRGGIPESLQYLFVTYKPDLDPDFYPVDFTWEREWRYQSGGQGLPVFLEKRNIKYHPEIRAGALIVERDRDVPQVFELLDQKAREGIKWAPITPVISLQTARRKLDEGDDRYARIETWPDRCTLA